MQNDVRHRVVLHRTADEGDEALLRPRAPFGPPALELVGPMPSPGAAEHVRSDLCPPGLQWYWRADFVKELSDEAIARHVEHGSTPADLQSTMHLYPIERSGGARAAATRRPWAYRDATWAEVIVGVDPDPANAERITDVVQALLGGAASRTPPAART